MLLTLLNNLGTGSVARTGQLDGNAAAPQVHPLAAGAAVVFAVAVSLPGTLGSTQTFGSSAPAVYNAEAEKTSVWSSSSAPPLLTGVLGTFVGAAAQQDAGSLSQPPPQIQSAAVAGPGFLGTVAWAIGQDPTQRAPWVQSAATSATFGTLGAFAWVWPGQSTWQPAPQYSAAVVAGRGILGRFAWAWPGQDPTQVPPWYARAVVAGPGILGAFIGSYQQDGVKQTPPVLVWAPTVSYNSGFLGSFIGIGTPQSQVQPPPQVQPALALIPPPPVAARYFSVPEQFQDVRSGWVWPAVQPSGGGLPSNYSFGAHAVAVYNAESAKSVVWQAAVTPILPTGPLGTFIATAEQRQDRPTVQARAAALPAGEQDVLGRFVATLPQDPPQRSAVLWRLQPFIALATGRLGSFAFVPEQPQDRPTYQARPAPMPGPLSPAGPVAEIVAWAVSQTGIQGARSCFIEGSGYFVYAEYFDYFGDPSMPASVAYRVDDRSSKVNLVPWTALVPAVKNRVYVTPAQNVMVNLTRQHETHQVLIKVIDGTGDVDYARVLVDVIRAPVS